MNDYGDDDDTNDIDDDDEDIAFWLIYMMFIALLDHNTHYRNKHHYTFYHL